LDLGIIRIRVRIKEVERVKDEEFRGIRNMESIKDVQLFCAKRVTIKTKIDLVVEQNKTRSN
jgi:hypothetical protein